MRCRAKSSVAGRLYSWLANGLLTQPWHWALLIRLNEAGITTGLNNETHSHTHIRMYCWLSDGLPETRLKYRNCLLVLPLLLWLHTLRNINEWLSVWRWHINVFVTSKLLQTFLDLSIMQPTLQFHTQYSPFFLSLDKEHSLCFTKCALFCEMGSG